MTAEKLSDLAVIAMHCHNIPIHRDKVCDKYMAMHPGRMVWASLLGQRSGWKYGILSLLNLEKNIFYQDSLIVKLFRRSNWVLYVAVPAMWLQ